MKKISAWLFLWVFLGFLIVFVLFLYFVKLIEPSSVPQNVFISNVTDHQAAISWTTTKATRGAVLISEDGRFPLLPVFTTVYRDDGEKNLSKSGFYNTHFVTIGKLKSDTKYKFRIYQDWKRVYDGSFATGSTLESITTPNPVYGRVLSEDKKTAVAGALVYLQAVSGASPSAFISTMTNTEGRWTLDLGNLRTTDFKDAFKVATSSAELVLVDGAAKGRFKAKTKPGQDKPWPDIILKQSNKELNL